MTTMLFYFRAVANNFSQGLFGKSIFLVLLLLGTYHTGWAQQSSDYDIQANIIYRFTKYINWPENKRSGDFVIGTVGDSPLTDALKNFTAGKLANGRRIVIKRYTAATVVFDCHILFISEEEDGSLKKIAARTANDAILLLSESEGMAQKGACINFIIVAEHLKLEINKNNIEQRNLSIASELLQLGKVVK